jgi:hypothetical protein
MFRIFAEIKMTKKILAIALLSISGASLADDLSGLDKFLCSPAQVIACFEGTDCLTLLPWEADIPQFVVVDIRKKLVSTTKGSGENRSTPIQSVQREDSTIYLQGIEGGRAFSFVIDEPSGLLTFSVARDGLTVTVFGACTDTDV